MIGTDGVTHLCEPGVTDRWVATVSWQPPLMKVYTPTPVWGNKLAKGDRLFLPITLVRELGTKNTDEGAIYDDYLLMFGTGTCALYLLPTVLLEEDLLKRKSPNKQASQLVGQMEANLNKYEGKEIQVLANNAVREEFHQTIEPDVVDEYGKAVKIPAPAYRDHGRDSTY